MARDRISKGRGSARWFALAAGALIAAGCAPHTPDATGKGEGAPTIVSLNPCLDAILVELASPAQVLGLSHYSRDLLRDRA